MLWHEDAPEAMLSAQCPPWSAALARLILSPCPAGDSWGQSREAPGCHQSLWTVGLGRQQAA